MARVSLEKGSPATERTACQPHRPPSADRLAAHGSGRRYRRDAARGPRVGGPSPKVWGTGTECGAEVPG